MSTFAHPADEATRLASACFVIVGAGQAGGQAASTLREQGFRGRIVLLGGEEHRPYMRPPLSKQVLADGHELDRVYLRPLTYYADRSIELRTGCRVVSIDRPARLLRLACRSSPQPYDRLLLATGARPRLPTFFDAPHPQVHVLRTLDDALRLREQLRPGARLVVVGGGYVGLEVAAAAAQRGLAVTVLERAPRLLERVTTPEISAFFETEHRAHGVEVRCGAQVQGLSFADGRLQGVWVGSDVLPADLVLLGIGALPDDALAREARLECDDGIVVDEACRTSDPDIFAAGDCTRHPNALFGRRLRLESVQNAVDQATVAAMAMLGKATRYVRVPWFWSQQYGLKLQSAGLSEGCDEAIERGDHAAKRFARLYFRAGQLIGVDAINLPGEYLAARKAMAARGELPTAPAAPAAPAAPVASVASGAAPAPANPPAPATIAKP